MINSFWQPSTQKRYLEALTEFSVGADFVKMWESMNQDDLGILENTPEVRELLGKIPANGGSLNQLVQTLNFVNIAAPLKTLLGDGFIYFCNSLSPLINQVRNIANYRQVKFWTFRDVGFMFRKWTNPNHWVKVSWLKHLSQNLTKGKRIIQQQFKNLLGKYHNRVTEMSRDMKDYLKNNAPMFPTYEQFFGHMQAEKYHKKLFPKEGLTLETLPEFLHRIRYDNSLGSDFEGENTAWMGRFLYTKNLVNFVTGGCPEELDELDNLTRNSEYSIKEIYRDESDNPGIDLYGCKKSCIDT